MDDIEHKISKASSSTSARFKRKKIRSMKREATKIAEKMKEKTNKLRTIEANPIQQSSQLSKMNKRIKKKIRFTKGYEYINLAFNSRMTPVYILNDIDSIEKLMIDHMAQQVDNPALRDSKFVFDSVIHMDINTHRLNLTRGSSYIQLPDWLAKKKTIINPKNLDLKCFKWSVIAALKWREIGR